MSATTSKNSLRVLDPGRGDQTIGWDPDDPEEVARARALFDELLQQRRGYMAYTLDEEGRRGQQLREFDPEARQIILAPALRGG